MPKKLMTENRYPTLVQERCMLWGQRILDERLTQRITMAELCERSQISVTTLSRLERGDPGVASGACLCVLNVLGIMNELMPMPSGNLQRPSEKAGRPARRVRHPSPKVAYDDF